MMPAGVTPAVAGVLSLADELRWRVPPDFHERCVEQIYGESAKVASRNVAREGDDSRRTWQRRLDAVLTGRWTGFPAMVALLAVALWLTIVGANVPSGMLASLLVDTLHPMLKSGLAGVGVPWWLNGVLVDGVYLTTAWVISVMLPPMAIFFPMFTLLEDFGYLPRVAFNLDRLFQKAGAHGKQALTMTMGWGCNAAGVTACRIIDSPRERLVAILTNNFALCNGRWPTQILVATVFLGALVPPALAGVVAAAAVLGVALLGVALSFAVSWGLSKTLLRGEASAFSLELPPYRPPRFWRTFYTSLIDRTLFVLWRAIVFAVPAGIAIWCVANIDFGGRPVALWIMEALEPLAWLMGLTGVILLAYIIAIPANEIVIPSILMLTVLVTGMTELGQGAGVMFEAGDSVLKQLLTAGGWTTLTAVCLMLFSLCHNPCSTTLYTIYKETGSLRWTIWSAAIPLVLGFVLCAGTAAVWRLFT
jgi:ferrous iron transport protein B